MATLATSGGWSSIKELVLDSDDDDIKPLSLMEAEDVSNFILQSENLRTLSLEVSEDQAGPMMEALSRTKVQSLKIFFNSTLSLQNGGRQLASALEKCTCITELLIGFPFSIGQAEVIQILFLEAIPKMLGLKKLELDIYGHHDDEGFFDMVGQCIGGHQGDIEELRIRFPRWSSVSHKSIVGLAPALRRLKVVRCYSGLITQQIGELSGIAADCDTLEEFWCDLDDIKSTDDFKNICHFLSTFPSLKRVTKERVGREVVELREESRFVAFLEMVKTSKTIEQIPPFRCRTNEKEAAIKHHCRSNMVHNQIREKDFLAATVPSSACPLILKEFSDLPDVLYYLLQQKNGAMVGPTCHG